MKSKGNVTKFAIGAALLVSLPLLAFFCSGGAGKKQVRVDPGFYVGRGATSQGGNVSLEVRSEIQTLFFQILPKQGCAGLPSNLEKRLSPTIPFDSAGSFRQQFDLENRQYVLAGKFDGQGGVSGSLEAAGKDCTIGFDATRDTSSSDSDADGVPDAVDPDATPAGCGDGAVQPPEECDDGNRIGMDACKNDCTLNVCGDGVRRLGVEQCDEGSQNSDAPNGPCRSDCKSRRCGDAILDNAFGEACDDGNNDSGDGCDEECKTEGSQCGDGVVQPPEECDDGNQVDQDACKNDCTEGVCGDGVVRIGVEQCDAGSDNSNEPNAPCRIDCKPRRCGDAIIDDGSGEECDDGNAVSGDGCSSRCKNEGSERGAFRRKGRTIFD